MSLISVEGIKIYAYHGHLPEEEILGGHFNVNVWVTMDISRVEETDCLEDTLEYVAIISLVKEQMSIRSRMIEHCSKRIVNAILKLKSVQTVKVEVEKINPPIDATFDKISVTTEGKN